MAATKKPTADQESFKQGVHSLEESATEVTSEINNLTSAFAQSSTVFWTGAFRVMGDTLIEVSDALTRNLSQRRKGTGERRRRDIGVETVEHINDAVSEVTRALGRAVDESAKLFQESGERFRTIYAHPEEEHEAEARAPERVKAET